MTYETKDSGARVSFDSGMHRDVDAGKPRFDLMVPLGVPYEEQILTRFASLLARGSEKYDPRNWERADSQEELQRFRSSAFRHFFQWLTGEADEDHASAVFFNIMAAETLGAKLDDPPATVTTLPEQPTLEELHQRYDRLACLGVPLSA